MNRCLSYAGRLQLIISVLSSIQVFWASHLCLPSKVLRNIEQKLCSFLWKGVDGNCRGPKVAWADICLPKNEGGLDIKDLISWNKALMIRHLWNLHIIGNGLGTSLWFDNWHPDDPILLNWSSRAIYDSGLPNRAKVSSIILGDQCVWPCFMSIELLEIKNHMPSSNPNSSLEDCINWLPTSDGIYTVASTMASLKASHPLVPWFELM
ncbi:hypothetical protein Q3G72_019353 [Acer saccharum]|nr:hypothetical protein Q3G72_019353 [Acer saccharum]